MSRDASKKVLADKFREAGIEEENINIVETDQGFSVQLAGEHEEQYLMGLVPFDPMFNDPFVAAMVKAWEEGAPDEHAEDSS